ncbi:MAG: metal-dependent hydrolase [Cyclobacteriaceae bacterium]|nr:metal-dependent hydrolase [Cyclobacteriaceae bacterium]
MDSLTHIVLGGCIGEAMGGKQLGKKAIVLGAVAQSLPDIDFVASFWLNPANDLLAHRGFTHSFLFVALAAPVLSLIADKYVSPGILSMRRWLLFFGLQVFVHVFLDAFNAYGVAWFEPFSHSRVSFNAIFVADPLLSAPLAVAFAFLVMAGLDHPRRLLAARLAILWWALYLGYGVMNKLSVEAKVKENFEQQQIPVTRHFSTPTPLNTWLWYIVANTDQGSYVGYRSVFDSSDTIDFEFFERADHRLIPIADHEDLQHLKRFSEGFYTVEQWGDTLVFNDLRFGQMIGWRDRRAHFVFHYYLSHPEDNNLVVQRGRFAGWDADATRSLLNRIAGH